MKDYVLRQNLVMRTFLLKKIFFLEVGPISQNKSLVKCQA